jgi:hypothetical protein
MHAFVRRRLGPLLLVALPSLAAATAGVALLEA